MRKSLVVLKLFVAAALYLSAAAVAPSARAEDTVSNPLRPKASDSRRAKQSTEARQGAETKQAEAAKPESQPAKPRRERSAAQKQNDDMMRACGQEWRAEKAALQAKGETWRSFLKDCRSKKKADIKA
jgi:hypothetical protein